MQSTMIESANLFRLVHFFDVLAAVVFAVSGALVASRKGMDVMGFMWFAVITGVGGGTVRDLILNVPVFWVQNPVHVSACLLTAVVMHFVAPLVESRYRTLLWFDAFGLALVTVAGTVKALDVGAPALVAIVMGVVTGSVGGIIRDTLGHVPSVILRHEIYVTASVLGACAYIALNALGLRASRSHDRRLSRDVRRTRIGDQVRVVIAGLPGIGDPRALEEETQRVRVAQDYLRNCTSQDARIQDDARPPSDYRGDDKLLFGIILGVLAFWLFAQTTLNIAPAMAADLNVATSVMNIAVSITALFSGIFIVVIGGLADRLGRVKILMWGFVFSIVGSVLVGVAPPGALATPLLMLGRICQGLSGAFIMPASLALIKTYWDDAGRQRAVSLWSMGSWGGSGFAALFGGLMAQNVGWRWIFFASAAVSVLGMLMVRGTPESKARRSRELYVRHEGRADVHGDDGRAAGVDDPGQPDRLDEPDHARPGGDCCHLWGHLLQGRVHSAISVRELRALSQRDLHGSDCLELPVERRCRDAAGVDDAGAGRWWPVGAGGRDADARLRDCHRCLHPRGRETACRSSARAGR